MTFRSLLHIFHRFYLFFVAIRRIVKGLVKKTVIYSIRTMRCNPRQDAEVLTAGRLTLIIMDKRRGKDNEKGDWMFGS